MAAVMASTPKWNSELCSALRKGDKTSYEDIGVNDQKVLHWIHFSWYNHGVVILAQTLGLVADSISEEFTQACEVTNGKIGDMECDTKPVRDALKMYVMRMFVVCHDDYPYDQLNRVLPLLHKVFLKKIACFPERLTKADYWRMRKYESLSYADIVHY